MKNYQVSIIGSDNKVSSLEIKYAAAPEKINLSIVLSSSATEDEIDALLCDYSTLVRESSITYELIDDKLPAQLVKKLRACNQSFTAADLNQIAKSVWNLVARNPLNAPNLNLRTAANLRKIKNYIYHGLKIKLSLVELQCVLDFIEK